MTKHIDFRELIQRELKKNNMSVPELARRIGKNHQTIYNYLACRTSMRDDTLTKILIELQIEIRPNLNFSKS